MWIKVEDRLPEKALQQVLICFEGDLGREVETAFYSKNCGWAWDVNHPVIETVTHWQPLPTPPDND